MNPDNAILRFTEPIESNGNLTVSYWIEYKNMDDNILEGLCLTKKEYATKNHEYVLKGIDPGNYSISVRAISLAGAGKPTEQYFIFVGESYYTGPSPRVIIYAILVMLLTGGMTFNLYYYRHFLKIWVSRRYRTAEDESDLVEDVEPINFDTAGALMHRRMESEFSDEEFSYWFLLF